MSDVLLKVLMYYRRRRIWRYQRGNP